MRRAEVAPTFSLVVVPLRAEHCHATPEQRGETCKHGFIIAVRAVSVQFDHVVEERLDVVLGLGRSGWRDLNAVPRSQVRIGLALKRRELELQSFDASSSSEFW